MNILVNQRKNSCAEKVQKTIRGFVSRNKTIELMKRQHLGDNMVFFEGMKEELMNEC